MIKFFLLFLFMFLTAASNVTNGTEVGQFELRRPNVNGTEGGLRRLMKNFQDDGVRSPRRNLAAYSYKQHDGKDRSGGDITGSCGSYSSHQSIKNACNSKSKCIGYTLTHGDPWCLKTTSSAPIANGFAHVYYEKVTAVRTKEDNNPCPKFDKETCCSRIDGRTDGWGNQDCYPPKGDKFWSGNKCEPESWIDSHSPAEKGSCARTKEDNKHCPTFDKETCCSRIDGRTDVWGNQDCYPPKGDEFKSGNKCEPESWIDSHSPAEKGSCDYE